MDFFNHKAFKALVICNCNNFLANKIKKYIITSKSLFSFENAFELNILLIEIKFIIVYLHFNAEFITIQEYKYDKNKYLRTLAIVFFENFNY